MKTKKELTPEQKVKKQAWREANKLRIKEQNKIWYENNKADKKIRDKEYREKNKESIKLRNKEYYDTNEDKRKEYLEINKERIIAKRNEYLTENKDIISERQKNWLETNPDRVKEIRKQYREKNKDKINLWVKQHRNSTPLLKVKTNIRNLITASIRNNGFKKSAKSEQILGCTYSEFKQHIESKFEDWMTWDNYGNWNGTPTEPNTSWDIDHIKPISNALNESELIVLNHYTNLQPLCSYVNRWVKSNN